MNYTTKLNIIHPAFILFIFDQFLWKYCRFITAFFLFLPALAVATEITVEKGVNSVTESHKTDGVLQHIKKIQEIADANGGNREAGSHGHTESVHYFSEQLHNAGLKVRTEKFEFLYSKPEHARLVHGGKELVLVPAVFGPSTPGAINSQPYFISGDGCKKQQYRNVPRNSIVMIKELAHCTVLHQYRLASESGARAVLIASNTETPLYIWLEGAGHRDIPLAGISQPTLAKIHASPSGLTLNIQMVTERRWSMNLIAENAGTSDIPAVEVGAHLDSVPQSAGINDNATSAALLLEHATSHANQPNTRTYRYMFWSGEEFAFAGSRNYLQTVIYPENIYAYINLEMQTSPNSGYFYIQDPNGGDVSKNISNSIIAAYQQLGIEADPDTNTIPRSDDTSYKDVGIPTGGLWGGSFEIKTPEQAGKWGGRAGSSFDDCYHLPCDNSNHIDKKKLGEAQFVLNHVLMELGNAHD